MVFEYEDRQIKICNSVLYNIKRYLQCDIKSCEAGGVLIGRENISNNNLIIEFATEPMPGDTRSRNRFYRNDKGHTNFYQKLYKEYQGIYVYVGEWHTHPEAIPSYSIIDLINWKKIRIDAGHNRPQYHLIAGYDALRLWEFSSITRKVSKLVTIEWGEVMYNEKD